MTKYRVFFTNSESYLITPEGLQTLVDGLARTGSQFQVIQELPSEKKYIFNATHITHIVPEETLEGKEGVVTPLTPDQVSEAKKKEHDAKISDPSAIIEGIKEKEDA